MSTLFIGYGLGIFSAALLLVVALDLRKAPTRRQGTDQRNTKGDDRDLQNPARGLQRLEARHVSADGAGHRRA